MIRKYYTLTDVEVEESEVEQLNGEYQLWYWEEDVAVKKEVYLDNKLVQLFYTPVNEDRTTIAEQHKLSYPGIKFGIVEKDSEMRKVLYSYNEAAEYQGKQVSYAENKNIDVEEYYDTNDSLTGGTKYLSEGEDVLYALEFGKDREFFNCYDFGSGDTLALAEAINIYKSYQ